MKLSRLENLMARHPELKIVFDKNVPIELGGYVVDKKILMNPNISEREQYQWLYEELGHDATTVGDISDYGPLENAKQERQARVWGFTHCFTRADMDRLRREYAEEDSDYPAADDLGIEVPYLHEVGLSFGLHYKHVLD